MLSRIDALVDRTADPRRAAAVRIGLGLAGLVTGLETGALLVQLGSAGGETLRLPVAPSLPDVTDALALRLAVAWLVLAVLLLLGTAARVAAAGLSGLAVAALLLDQSLYSNHLVLYAVLTALLAATGPAQRWRIGRARPRTVPWWPLWLMRTQLSSLYAFTALGKLNERFLGGHVLAAATHEPVASTLAARPGFATAVAGATVAVELGLAIAMWLPSTHRIAVPVGVALHLAIVVTVVPTLPLVAFALTTLAAYPAAFGRPLPAEPTAATDRAVRPSGPARRRARA